MFRSARDANRAVDVQTSGSDVKVGIFPMDPPPVSPNTHCCRKSLSRLVATWKNHRLFAPGMIYEMLQEMEPPPGPIMRDRKVANLAFEAPEPSTNSPNLMAADPRGPARAVSDGEKKRR